MYLPPVVSKPVHPMEPCPHCKTLLRKDRMARHMLQCPKRAANVSQWKPEKYAVPVTPLHQPPKPMAPPQSLVPPQSPQPHNLTGVTVRSLPFELLPPGSWDISHLIEHYRLASANRGPALQGRVIDWQRLEKLSQLGPQSCYVGKDGWDGYVVFGLADTRRVVLECPIEGNATYILSGEWRRAVEHTKQYLRDSCPEFCGRVVHRGDWLKRIRRTLKY